MTPPDIERMTKSEIVKNVALLAVIKELKKTYTIGLLSNISDDWITRELLTPEEQELFDVMVLSYQTGMTKPDPRMYMLACERLRVAPHETVMVDDIENFVAAAENEGLQGIVYKDLDDFVQQLSLLTRLQEEVI